jgi:hypothetical protein
MQPLLAADVRKGGKHELQAIKGHTEAQDRLRAIADGLRSGQGMLEPEGVG